MGIFNKAAGKGSGALRRVAGMLDKHGEFAFLDARQMELGEVPAIDLEAVLLAYLAGERDFFFVQIGAHAGDDGDPIFDHIRRHRLRGVLVEPQAGPFAQLMQTYADQPQLRFERAAIAPSDGTATFYKVDPAFWKKHGFFAGIDSQISSLNREQIRYHVELFGGSKLAEDESAYLRTEQVPALTLASLCTKHGVDQIDLLQIDTEGFDYEVLKMIDFARPPRLIQYEVNHLSIEDRKAAWQLLRDNGYRLYAPNVYNTLAIHVAPAGDAPSPT